MRGLSPSLLFLCRRVSAEDDKEQKMSFLVNLLVKKKSEMKLGYLYLFLSPKVFFYYLQEFYKKIEREDMYIRFVNLSALFFLKPETEPRKG